ncbi:Hypothetical predicted protein [Mytilus galloprovincialis]|uniref:Uncharacterized protein n=1 Tax=Mytilus galloprovincialis TaxID=29158 RepID=A0A8B6F4J1_MYTGA|nr:Hypothetical predicted protein [Mytilus galloprovincialis]
MIVKYYTNLMFTRNDMNPSAFELAAENGHFEIAKYFLDQQTSFGNFLSMHHAAENGHSDIVELLLQYDIKDSCLPFNGAMYWIPDINIAIVHKLDFNVRSSNGSTPYHSAAVCNSLSLSMFTLTDFKKKLTIPDLKYFNGRSIVEYGCSTLQSIHDFGAYADWVNANFDPSYEGYKKLEVRLNAAFSKQEIDEKKALGIYSKCMNGEANLFGSVPI